MIELDTGRLDELAALVAVAKAGSFVAAGRSLERHATIVSKRIASLERRLGAEGYDAALRVGTLTDSRLVARRLGQHRRILCASPAYVERHGAPETPAQLAAHDCLEFQGFASFPNWRLSDGRRCETVTARG